jgi:ATP-dependent DNA ligase
LHRRIDADRTYAPAPSTKAASIWGTLLIIERHKARAYTRNGFDWSESHPGITKAVAKLDCRSAIIDGEIIVQNERGVSDFESLKSAIRWATNPDNY